MTALNIACLLLAGCGLIPPTPAQAALRTSTAQCQQGNGQACQAMAEMVSANQLAVGESNAAWVAQGGLWPRRNTVIVAPAVNAGIGAIQPMQPMTLPAFSHIRGTEMTQYTGRPAKAARP